MLDGLQEKGLPAPIQDLIAHSEKVNWADKKIEPEDLKPILETSLNQWRETLSPGADQKKGKTVEAAKDVYIVLAGEEAARLDSATDGYHLTLLIPLVDGLRLNAGNGDLVFNVTDRAVGGSQLELRSEQGNMRKTSINREAWEEAKKAMWRDDLMAVAKLKNQAIKTQSMAKVVLTGGQPLKWGDMMGSGDKFRIDQISGGLIKAECWGPVDFRIDKSSYVNGK